MFFCCCFFLIKVTISLVTWQWEGVDCLFLASATRTVCITIATAILRPCPVILTNTDMNSNTVNYRTYSVMNDPCKLQHPGALSLLNKLFLGDRSRGHPLPLHRTDVNSQMRIHVLHRDKGKRKRREWAKTNSASPDCPASSYAFNQRPWKAKFHQPKHACTRADTRGEAGGQNKVVTPEEKIRMTKENGTESGELWGGGQRRRRC